MTLEAFISNSRRITLIGFCFIAFISLGLPDGLLGVAWPSIRADFKQPLDALGALVVATTAGYMLSSFFNGVLSRHLGIGRLLALSCLATGLALLGFTLVPFWFLIVALGLLLGLGAGAIDASLNGFVAEHYSERLMQWLHASFGVGITLGPLIMTTGLNLTGNWMPGYWLVAAAQLALGLGFFLTARLWDQPTTPSPQPALAEDAAEDAAKVSPAGGRPPGSELRPASFRMSLKYLPVWLSMLLFFCYTGLELTLGLWGYSLLTEARGIAAAQAGLWIAVYWGMFTLGRVLAGLVANSLGNHRLVLGSLILALLGGLLLWWNPLPWLGLASVGLIGFGFAPIFPGLVSGTRQRVGRAHLANAMGMQIAAAGVGMACLPALAGLLADYGSLEVIPVFMLTFMLMLTLAYGLSRVTAPQVSSA